MRLPQNTPANSHRQVSNIVIIKAAIERFTLSGRMRVTLRPLMNQLPLIGSGGGGGRRGRLAPCCGAGQVGAWQVGAWSRVAGWRQLIPGMLAPRPSALTPLPPPGPLLAAQVSFTQLPRFSFDLTLFGGDASLLPGLETCERCGMCCPRVHRLVCALGSSC